MKNKIFDLRSDTVTKPTQKMREAMAKAEVGDDVYGEDPTVNLLEKKAAEILGKEAAIFVPSGTMGNQIAIKCHTNMGDEVVVESTSHIYNYELGAMSAISGTVPRVIVGEDGFFDEEQLKNAIRPKIYYLPKTTLVCLENTHNMAGGRCLSLERAKSLCKIAKENNIKTHLDGARIFNAAIALNTTTKEIAEPFDSVMFCISKGLSAPVGSLLVGSREFIEKARVYRKMFGGGMRQAGVLAVCGLIAFEEVLPELHKDHEKAKRIARSLSKNPFFQVDLNKVETNIFMIKVNSKKTAKEVVEKLKEKGILVSSINQSIIRIVTHKDISFEDADYIAEVFENFEA